MEYVKLYTALLTHAKAEQTSDRAWRCLTLAWLYAGAHETEGAIPEAARRVIRLTDKTAAELESLGWWHRNGDGWVLNDWGVHQAEGDALVERRRRDRERKAEARRQAKGGGA